MNVQTIFILTLILFSQGQYGAQRATICEVAQAAWRYNWPAGQPPKRTSNLGGVP